MTTTDELVQTKTIEYLSPDITENFYKLLKKGE